MNDTERKKKAIKYNVKTSKFVEHLPLRRHKNDKTDEIFLIFKQLLNFQKKSE